MSRFKVRFGSLGFSIYDSYDSDGATSLEWVLNEFERRLREIEERHDAEDRSRMEQSER